MLNKLWDEELNFILQSKEFNEFYKNILNSYNEINIYPKKEDIFKAFKLTDYDKVKVVILGQDPYHGYNQADGLAFSVPSEVSLPPSLKNIFKEIYDDLGILNINGSLVPWAKQGVLLLNTILTVKEGSAGYFFGTYWEKFTDEVIKIISKRKGIIFLLWGNYAKKKQKLICDGNFILETSHPSPLGVYRGFRGSKIFSKTNDILKKIGKEEINWQT